MKPLSLLMATGLLVLTTACSQPAQTDAPAQDSAQPTEEATPAGFELDAGSQALLAALSPKELGLARLSCVRPINSAKAVRGVFDAETTAELASIDYLSQTDIITSIEGMTIADARAIMDASPDFKNGTPATGEQVAGVKQCIALARHYAAEKAAG